MRSEVAGHLFFAASWLLEYQYDEPMFWGSLCFSFLLFHEKNFSHHIQRYAKKIQVNCTLVLSNHCFFLNTDF